MVLFREIGWLQIVLSALFLVLATLYVIRVARIGRALNTPYYNVFLKAIMRTVAFGLLLFAFLGPSFGDSKKEVKSIGKDIMICVDLSKSMDAFDIQPTRLEKVKYEMKKIVEAFASDRLGVIIFSSEAFMQCPLTFDQNALDLFIETMNTGLVPPTGTDFGPPLKLALSKLDDPRESATQQTSKVIILISDGEDFGEDTGSIEKEIEEHDIRLFTLGVGTEKGSPIFAGHGYKTDNKGTTVVSKLNPGALKSLAKSTGGQYFEINESRNDVSRLINTVNRIEGELRDVRSIDVSANRYTPFLFLAFVLLVADLLVNFKTVNI